ncbi:MAG: hypothetical protein MI754_01035 [Chromatiales bacterium]|nr:hypothetical protein [Chromatiales bacterium]
MHLRTIYRYATGLLAMLGLAAASYIFLASLTPSAKARSDAMITVDVSDLQPGEIKIIAEKSAVPIIILRRSQTDISRLYELSQHVKDPFSHASAQPDYAKNIYRSISPDYFVTFGYEARKGIRTTYRANTLPYDYYQNVTWYGGFHENFDGAIFDKAGRVYQRYGHPNQQNLPIPEYSFDSATTISINLLDTEQ